MTVYHTTSRTRASTWVPRRVFYVLRFLQRQLTAGKPQALSNKQIQEGTRFGSEGEVSQIMRWLSGELPTMGRWAYGCLNTNPQQYRFITRERMPHGGYLITLLGTPESIAPSAPRLPEIVQLSFFENDPSVIPQRAHQDAAQGGSFFHDPLDSADPPQPKAAHTRSQGDQHEENQHESTSSSVGAHRQKCDWSQTAIDDGYFLPIAALEKAGVTPQIFQAAERKITTRCEYDRDKQIRTLISSLLAQQPIYSAAEMAARVEENQHETAASAGRGTAGTRRQPRAHPSERSTGGIPDQGRDAEFAAMRAEFERIARERGVSRL